MKLTFALGAGIIALSTTAVSAMPHCAARDSVVASLQDRYAERHIASGLQSDTGLLEIWASDVDGSWTVLMTRPDGQTCVVASGTHWLEQDTMNVALGEPA